MPRYLLVADGGTARILALSDEGAWAFKPVAELTRPSAKLSRRQMTSDAPGRVFARASRGNAPGPGLGARSSAGSDDDPHVVEVARFAKRIVARLDRLRQSNRMTELLLIVEPRFLGALREHMPAPLRRRVKWEYARDFVKADDERIAAALTRARIPRALAPVRARTAARGS
jgi:protein required for attachment to host cells